MRRRRPERPPRPRATDPYRDLIAAQDQGDRWPHQRQAPAAAPVGPAGYTGSARTLRRAVARGQGGAPPAAPRLSALAAGARRAPGHRLGRHRRPARLLRGARLEPGAVRALRRARGPGRPPCACSRSASRPSAACPPWCSPTAWAASRAASSPTSWCRHPDTSPSPATTASGPTSARRRTPSRRAWSSTSWAMPSATWSSAAARSRDVPSANARRDRLVHRGQRPGPQRDQRRARRAPRRRSGRCCGRCRRCDRPSGSVHVRTVDHLRTVRFGSARYSVPGCLHRQAGRGQRRGLGSWSSAMPAPRSPATRSWVPAR